MESKIVKGLYIIGEMIDNDHAAAPSKPMLKENVGALMKELQTAGFEWS